jgi:5-bromo-4-chloroindolyl phosphate hydrolysis protein
MEASPRKLTTSFHSFTLKAGGRSVLFLFIIVLSLFIMIVLLFILFFLYLSSSTFSSFYTSNSISSRAGFKEERQWRSRRGLHQTEIESTDFIETLVPLKSRKVNLYF